MLRSGATRSLLLGLALAAVLGGPAAAADLWRWIDADGIPRYTPDPDRVPSAQRSTLVRVEPGMAPAAQREPAAAKPPAIFAPPGDPALAADPWNEPERARAVEGEVVDGELLVEVPGAEPAAPPAVTPAPAGGGAEPLGSVDAAPAVSAAPATPPAIAPAERQTAPPPEAARAVAGPPASARAPQAAPAASPGPAATKAQAPQAESRVASSQSGPPEPPPEVMGEVVVELPGAELPTPAPESPPGAAQPPAVDAGPGLPVAPAGAGAPASALARTPEPTPAPADRAARRAELLAAIARDEEALKAHVSSTGAGQLAASAELREIAERLPALQAELRALEAQGATP